MKRRALLLDEDTKAELLEKRDEELLRLSIKHPHMFELLIDRYEDAFLRKAQSVIRGREDA